MNHLLLFMSLILISMYHKIYAKPDTLPLVRQNVSIMFYNVENLYDPYDDSTTLDDEFTRDGTKRYTWGKFRLKLNHLAKTIITAGGWDTVAFIGMCEVENRYVLNKLIYETPLNSYGYRIIHHDSPDARGVDVAALYNPKKMKLLGFKYYTVRFPEDPTIRTREILVVNALLFGGDTLRLIVNHWPSRRGGQEESSGRRNFVAGMVKGIVDSIIIENGKLKIENEHRTSNIEQRSSNILIMGDFNDDPCDESLCRHLGAAIKADSISFLYNLTGMKGLKWNEGTIRYRGRWSTFDQFIVTPALLDGTGNLITSPRDLTICRFPFLVQEDATWFGDKLNRTYIGPRFNGGFSDHLPVLIKIFHSSP